MANTFFSVASRNAQLGSTGLLPLLAAGVLKVYAGAQPANADVAITSQTLLATFTLANPAAPAPSGGVLTMSAIAAVTIAASGVANFARQFESDGVTALLDTNLGNQTVTLAAGASLGATSLTVTALSLPLYAGQDLWFVDAVSGVLKLASVSANAAAGATSVTVTSLGAAIANGSASSNGALVNSPNFQFNAQGSITAYTITAPAAGS